MKDPLSSYLHDHLAGSHFAVQLLDSLRDQFEERDLGCFAARLCAEVRADQAVLEALIVEVGQSRFDLTEAAGWFGEKASEIKLHRDRPGGGLGAFEALETMFLGIRGKLALWHALPLIRDVDAPLLPLDFPKLALRAEDQLLQVQDQRLRLVNATFGAC